MTSYTKHPHRRSRSLMAGLLVAAVLVAMPGISDARTVKSAQGMVIEDFHATLLDVMKQGPKLGFEGRYKKLAPAVKTTFALKFMTRVSAGIYWKSMTAAQRKLLIDTFTRATIATYAGRFKKFSGQRFVTIAEAPMRRGHHSITTKIIKSNGREVKLRYILGRHMGAWRVVDIHLKGTISQLAVWIAEHTSLLRRKGFDGLIDALDQKITRIRGKGN